MSDKPQPPYWTVIFPSQRTTEDAEGYGIMAKRMVELAKAQLGFLGMDSARDASGFGITVSYWQSLDAIEAWRNHPEHLHAQALGRSKWYAEFEVHIAKVERSYLFRYDK
ncbi:MAG: antibiotic biosynthesis monooxygenase [Rhodospirillales bacterium]|nr:antibiotic biosynthesis monooxygenase [Rhodospirillales bacterium]